MPEVRFDDVMIIDTPMVDGEFEMDPRYYEVCDHGTIEVCGVSCDVPVSVGTRVIGNKVVVRFPYPSSSSNCRLVVRLTGVRRGFTGMRFPARTRAQFEANERFINSAYPNDPEAEG